MLKIQNLQVAYGGIQALRGIDMEVPDGKIVTLIGANGAGKSTTLRTISGLVKAKSGSITYNNEQLLGKPINAILAAGIAQVPEGRRVFPDMTVLENLKIGAYLRKDKEEIEKDIEWVYELFPRLKERNWQLAGTLSGGEQQMLAVGRALMSRPKVLMMDEPSLGLAPLVVQGIFDIIREINRQGVTILLIEQNANMALKIADLAYVLETGTITMSGTGAELRPMKRSRRPISARSAANKLCEILTRFGKKHTMTVGRNAGGHFFGKGNQRKAIMVYLAVALSAALGGFVQSVTGFGAAVVMMTILPYFFTMAVAPSVSTSICLGLTVTLAWKLRKSIDLKLTLPPTLLYAAASVTAIRFIGSMDLRVMTMVFGAFLMLLGAYLLLTEKKAAIRVTPAVTVVCGLLAGVCGGLFSIGGPIMAIYYLAATDSRESYLANAQANFAVNNVTSITTRVLSGYYTLDLLPLTLLGVAGVVCGQRFGLKLGGKLNAVQLRRLVYAYIILSGAVTVVQHL